MNRLVLLALLLFQITSSSGNDFSSFLSANASLAVVVDNDYMHQRGENIMGNLSKILSDTIRDHFKNGGVNVKYFTWSSVRLKKNFIAAITVTDCRNTWNFFQSTQTNSVLLIAITDANCPRLPLDRALMIPMVKNGDEFPQMILDAKVQQVLKWKSCVLLLDESVLIANTQLVESLVHESSKKYLNPMSLCLYKIKDHLNGQRKRIAIRQALTSFAKSKRQNHFIVFSTFHEDIIAVAEELRMFNIYNHWLFFVLDSMGEPFDFLAATQHLGEGANIAFATNKTSRNCQDSMNCMISEVFLALVASLSRVIQEEQSVYGEISDEEWEAIRYTKREKLDEILCYMKDFLKENSRCSRCLRWNIKTALTWGKSQEHKNRSALTESINNKYEFIDVGHWSPLLGFNTNEILFPHGEHYFRNITLNILTYHNPPWQILTKDHKGNTIASSGIVIEILKELSRRLNFTYNLQEVKTVDDDYLGNYNESMSSDLIGSLTHDIPYPIVEMLQENKFLMAAVASTVDEPGLKPFNYTIPISIQKYTFLSRKPDEVSRIYLFMAPFTLETWASLVSVIILTAPLLYVVNILAPMDELKTRGLCNLKNCFWYIYGALLQQGTIPYMYVGGEYLPKADSGRMVIGVWWIVVIVLVTTYCGNLVAFLTFPKFQSGIDYLFQTFKQKNVQHFGLRNRTFFEKYSMSSTRKDFKMFMDRAIIYNNSENEGLLAVERGERVNIDWQINLQLTIQKNFEKEKECKFILGRENFVDEQIGLIMPANSPYLELVNDEIKLLFQMGFIERWHQTNLPSMDKCNGKGFQRQITNHKVNLDDMQGCLLVLLLGNITALPIL